MTNRPHEYSEIQREYIGSEDPTPAALETLEVSDLSPETFFATRGYYSIGDTGRVSEWKSISVGGIKSTGISDIGMRFENEDRAFITSPNPDRGLIVRYGVIDGMGGPGGGGKVADLLCQNLTQNLKETPEEVLIRAKIDLERLINSREITENSGACLAVAEIFDPKSQPMGKIQFPSQNYDFLLELTMLGDCRAIVFRKENQPDFEGVQVIRQANAHGKLEEYETVKMPHQRLKFLATYDDNAAVVEYLIKKGTTRFLAIHFSLSTQQNT
jgi:hypothetical protein